MTVIKGKKKAFGQLLRYSGFSNILLGTDSTRVMIFNFHRIRNDGNTTIYLFDDEVFGPTVSEFYEHMKWLKKNTNIISESDLLLSLKGKKTLPANSTMVTFDDGYIDNYTLALPILKELKIPAIFFIPTEAVNDRALGWWDKIAYLIKKTNKPVITLYGEKISVLPRRDVAKNKILDRMKLKSAAENETLLIDLAAACEVEMPSFELCSQEIMTWEHVKIAAESGITIGSHTHSHRVLSTLGAKDQLEELQFSKKMLEEKLGIPMRTLAYPVGGYEHFNTETKEFAQMCGYEAAFSFTHEINTIGSIDPYCIARLVAPEDISLYVGTVTLPKLYVQRRTRAAAPSSISYA